MSLWICYGRCFSGKWQLAILDGTDCYLEFECSRNFATKSHNLQEDAEGDP